MSIIEFLRKQAEALFGTVGNIRNPPLKGTNQCVVKQGLTQYTITDVYYGTDSGGNPSIIIEVQG